MDGTTSERKWWCPRCGALLGIERGGEVELKYKVALYRVRGTVEATCRRCGRVSCFNGVSNDEGTRPPRPSSLERDR
jgi:hypothetical protein